LGPDGLSEGVREGQIYIDMSTIAPGVAIKVAEELGKKGVCAMIVAGRGDLDHSGIITVLEDLASVQA
jgi:hypothetical protein